MSSAAPGGGHGQGPADDVRRLCIDGRDVPRADSLPFFEFGTRNVPSTTNALGIKGAGEAGTIGAAPAALNAVTDALWRAYGIGHIEMPATPMRIWAAIQAATAA